MSRNTSKFKEVTALKCLFKLDFIIHALNYFCLVFVHFRLFFTLFT